MAIKRNWDVLITPNTSLVSADLPSMRTIRKGWIVIRIIKEDRFLSMIDSKPVRIMLNTKESVPA
jgi:hypothetical protein